VNLKTPHAGSMWSGEGYPKQYKGPINLHPAQAVCAPDAGLVAYHQARQGLERLG